MNTVIYSGIGATIAVLAIGMERIRHKTIYCLGEIKSKKDSVFFLKSLCSKSTSTDELNDLLLINIRKNGYSLEDKERIYEFLVDNPKPTEEFALTVIYSMIWYYECLTSCDINTSSLVLNEQNLVTF